MSKSLGNSPDLLGLIDQYGADATRFGIMIASPAGNDILFDETALEQGRNFNNKIWNALKLIKMWEPRQSDTYQEENQFAINWFENRLDEVSKDVDNMMQQFRLSESLKTIYSLIWDDFCSWYLEWIKPGFEKPINSSTYKKTVTFFTELMQLIHPFMPFVSEEIYHHLEKRNDDLCIKQLSNSKPFDSFTLSTGQLLKNTISGIRDVRNKQQLKPKETIQLFIQTDNENTYKSIESILSKQLNTSSINFTKENIAGSFTTIIDRDKFYVVTEKPIDSTNQKAELEKELNHLKGFLISVEKKLSNEKFVQNAKPEVLAIEQKKKADAESKIKTINDSLELLN
jgi:valyl-tRNA synthetase